MPTHHFFLQVLLLFCSYTSRQRTPNRGPAATSTAHMVFTTTADSIPIRLEVFASLHSCRIPAYHLHYLRTHKNAWCVHASSNAQPSARERWFNLNLFRMSCFLNLTLNPNPLIMHLAALVKIGIRKFGVDVCIHVALCYGGGALGGKMRLPPLESCNGLLQHHRPEGRVRLGRACVNNCFIIPFAAGGGAMCERACVKCFPASMHIHAQKTNV